MRLFVLGGPGDGPVWLGWDGGSGSWMDGLGLVLVDRLVGLGFGWVWSGLVWSWSVVEAGI